MKLKLFEFNPYESKTERVAPESRTDFENEVNAFCTQVSVHFVTLVREDVIGVWYEGEAPQLSKEAQLASIAQNIRRPGDIPVL